MTTAPKTQFFLNGFTQELDFRVFAFDGVGTDRTRFPVTVRIDTTLARRYGITPQELPLLCRSLLDRCLDIEENKVLTYGEDEMCAYKAGVSAREEAANGRKPPRRPMTAHAGSPWHSPR